MADHLFIKVLTGTFDNPMYKSGAGVAGRLRSMAGSLQQAKSQLLTGDSYDLILSGTMMPYRPQGFDIAQRISEEEYIGNPTKTLQLLGVTWPPITFRGKFKARRLGVGVEELAFAALELLCRSGNLIEIRFKKNARVGIIKHLTKTYHRPGDIGYELSIVVRSDATVKSSKFEKAIGSLGDVAAAISVLGNELSSLASTPADIAKSALTAVSSIISNTTGVLNNLQNTISLYTSIGGDIEDLADQLTHTARTIITLTEQLGRAIESIYTFDNPTLKNPGLVSVKSTPQDTVDAGTDDVVFDGDKTQPVDPGSSIGSTFVVVQPDTSLPDKIKEYKTKAEISIAHMKVAAYSIEQYAKSVNKSSSTAQVLVTATPQRSLFDIAVEYFGDPTRAFDIARANGLEGVFVTESTLVRLPE